MTSAPIVVKYGGNVIVDEDLKRSFAREIVDLSTSGIKVAVVHGGGPQISTMLNRYGIEGKFLGGYRVTTPEIMSIVRTVLAGEVRSEIVASINLAGGNAFGLGGDDGRTFTAKRRLVDVSGSMVDIGLVGDVVDVNAGVIERLFEQGFIPVISSYASDASGQALNVNADTAAGTLASALGASSLIMLTDVQGVYLDWPDESSLVSRLSVAEAQSLLPKLSQGMVPKIEAALHAIRHGVPEVRIVDGRQRGVIARALAGATGTVISR